MILLDTHVVVWMALEPHRLSRVAASAIRRARSSDGMGVSDITLWEIGLLVVRRHISWQGTVESAVRELVQQTGVNVLSITPEIAALAAQFGDDYPRDPADKLIGATALAHGVALITRDERIRDSVRIKTIW